jgi:prophage regulatory protein
MKDQPFLLGQPLVEERPQFLRLRAVMKMTGLSRSTIYRLAACGMFPRPVRLSPRIVAWRWSDLERWSEPRPTVVH